MSCGTSNIINELQDLVNQIGGGGGCGNSCCGPPGCGPCCIPMTKPYVQVCMTVPPPCPAPTFPNPVVPLHIPCPKCEEFDVTGPEAEASRYANFYNNYNIDWHNWADDDWDECKKYDCPPPKCQGVTVDGNSPCCPECKRVYKPKIKDNGCPTGFKPCTMKLTPPPGCDPLAPWNAEIQKCPPGSKNKKKKKCC